MLLPVHKSFLRGINKVAIITIIINYSSHVSFLGATEAKV